MSNSIFKRGQQLKRGDLTIFLKSKDGTARNAAEIYYDIYFIAQDGTEVIVPPTRRLPCIPAIGEAFANFQIPLDANLGKYRIRWFFRQQVNSTQIQIVQEFNIIADNVQIVNLLGASVNETDLIRSLRILLRDNNPGRNYHFNAPMGENSINQFTRVFGFIWEDAELLEYLRVSLDGINMYPPQTFFQSIDDLITRQRNWRTLTLNGAMIYALEALAINWIVDQVNYSISGISLDIEKASQYQSMMNDVNTRFNDQVEAAKSTVLILRGLKQSRFGVGIRSSFGPSTQRGTLTPRKFVGF